MFELVPHENHNRITMLKSKVEGLRNSLEEKQSRMDSLEKDLHVMNSTIQKYQDGASTSGNEWEVGVNTLQYKIMIKDRN